jgi:hypothetical protein
MNKNGSYLIMLSCENELLMTLLKAIVDQALACQLMFRVKLDIFSTSKNNFKTNSFSLH